MKRIKITALMLALILTVSAIASCDKIKSIIPGIMGNNDSKGECEHFYFDGVCRLCSFECSHEWSNGSCKKCDKLCNHPNTEHNQTCKVCALTRKSLGENSYCVNVDGIEDIEPFTYSEYTPLNQMLSYIFPYSKYMFRWEIFDIYVNGKKVEREDGYTMMLSGDLDIKIELKTDAVRVVVSVIDGRREDTDLYYIPKNKLSIGLLGMLLFPMDGGFDRLLDLADVYIDGYEGTQIIDPSVIINEDCHIFFFVKEYEDSSKPEDSDNDTVLITLIFKDLSKNEYRSWDFRVKNGYELSELFERAFCMSFKQFEAQCSGIESDLYITVEPGHKLTNSDKIIVTFPSDPPSIACNHCWNDGTCERCFIRCSHSLENGKCTICGFAEPSSDPSLYATASVSHKQDHIEEVEYEQGILLSEFLSRYLGMNIEEFTTSRNYSMWVDGRKVSSDFILRGDVSIVYVDYTTSESIPEMCKYHDWNDGVCNKCKKQCLHVFNGDTCEICGYFSEGIDNPIYVIYDGKDYVVPYNCTLYDFITLYLCLDFDKTYSGGSWALISDGAELFPHESNLLNLYGRYLTLKYYEKENVECSHNFKDGFCVLCSMECNHVFKVGVCDICAMPCDHTYYDNVCSKCGYINDAYDEPAEKYVYTVIIDQNTVTIESSYALTGKQILKKLKIYYPSNFYAIVDDSITYNDMEKFRATMFDQSCTIILMPID